MTSTFHPILFGNPPPPAINSRAVPFLIVIGEGTDFFSDPPPPHFFDMNMGYYRLSEPHPHIFIKILPPPPHFLLQIRPPLMTIKNGTALSS